MENGTAYKTTVKGYIDDKGFVDRVETMIDQGMLGDTKWEATFSNYKDFGGVKVPTSIVQRQGGPKIWEMTVADVKVNQPVDMTPPADRGGRGGPGGGAARAATERQSALRRVRRAATAKVKVVPAADAVPLLPRPRERRSRRRILAGHGRLRRGSCELQRLHRRDRRPFGRRARRPDYQRSETAGSRQADQVRDQHARALRSLPGTTGLRGRGRDHHYESGQQGLLREGPRQSSHAGSGQSAEKNPKPKIKVEYVGDMKKITDGEHEIDLYKVMNSTHNYAMHDGVFAEAEDPDRGGRIQRAQSDSRPRR